jgi:aminopeptidase N
MSEFLKSLKYFTLSKINLQNFERIPADYRQFVYCTAIKHGSKIEWEFASSAYDTEMDASSRRKLQYAMSCTKEPWLITRYLNDQLNYTKVRRQDTILGLRYGLINSYSHPFAWNFIKQNWLHLIET